MPERQAIEGQVAKLVPSDPTYGAQFGRAVSLDGDTALVGAPWATPCGAAYLFYRDQGGPDAWGQVAKLTAAECAEYEGFGWSVDIDGGIAIVGSVGAEKASVFYRDQGGPDAWGLVATLAAADGAPGDEFGFSVSVDGDTAVVGAEEAEVNGNYHQGAAYVFYRDKGGADAWGQAAKLVAADGVADDEFGISVSIDGDTAVAGAWHAEVGGNWLQGAAYVFQRDQGGADAWGQVAKLASADGGQADEFGESVSASGDVALAGSFSADDWLGAGYLFSRDEGGPGAWGQAAKLSGQGVQPNEHFGASVSVDGDTAVVGSPEDNMGPGEHQGSAYVFRRDQGGPGAWGQIAKLVSSDGDWYAYFGCAVSVDGRTALIGALNGSVPWVPCGVAYIFALPNRPPAAADDAYAAIEDTGLAIPAEDGVLANDDDPDGDPLTALLVSGPSHGTLELAADGSFAYAPAADYAGPDAFVYRANDGLANSNPATVEIAVAAVNDAPVAANDAYNTPEDTPLTVAAPGVLFNDSDAENDPLVVVPEVGPLHGTLDLQDNGGFTYTPAADYAGPDWFTYHANDGQANSEPAGVEITVMPVNDAPAAAGDAYTTTAGVPLVVPAPGVLLNDTDPENDPLSAVLDVYPLHGTLVLAADGSFTYVPAAGYAGPDSFAYHANDGQDDSNTAVVDISVTRRRLFLPLVLRND